MSDHNCKCDKCRSDAWYAKNDTRIGGGGGGQGNYSSGGRGDTCSQEEWERGQAYDNPYGHQGNPYGSGPSGLY